MSSENNSRRRRRFKAYYVCVDFDTWEKKAKEKGLIGNDAVVEVLYHKNPKKSKEIFMRQEEQKEGVIERFEPELLKDVRGWDTGYQRKMSKLIREEKYKNFLHKQYPEFMKKKEQLEEKTSQDHDRPLFNFKDMNYTLSLGMTMQELQNCVIKTHNSATIEEFKKHMTGLKVTAQLVQDIVLEGTKPTELLHEPMKAPDLKRRSLLSDLEEIDNDLDLTAHANGTIKKVKSYTTESSLLLSRKESISESITSDISSPMHKTIAKEECIEELAEFSKRVSRTLPDDLDWRVKNPALAQRHDHVKEKILEKLRRVEDVQKFTALEGLCNLAFNVLFLENGGRLKILREYYKERGTGSWCEKEDERWLFKKMHAFLKVAANEYLKKNLCGFNLKQN